MMFICSVGGNWVKKVDGIVILASCEHNFIRVHESLVQHPSNNISILTAVLAVLVDIFYFS